MAIILKVLLSYILNIFNIKREGTFIATSRQGDVREGNLSFVRLADVVLYVLSHGSSDARPHELPHLFSS